MMKVIYIFAAIICIFLSVNLYAKDFNRLHIDGADILFETPLGFAAEEIAELYPELLADLENIFKWKLEKPTTIVLIKKREDFLRMAGNPLTVAFAIPEKHLVVIDYSTMIANPFSLESSLIHELCHLLMHQQVSDHILPKWLDEGFALWVSDSINEILSRQKRSILNRAAFNNRLIPLSDLKYRFPNEKSARLLAYEESVGFIYFIIRKFGNVKVLSLLNHLENGDKIEVAVLKTFAVSLDRLEQEWHRSLRSKGAWLTFFSHYLYEILFVMMALITLFAFIRLRFIKKNYRDEDEDEEFD